MAESNERRQSNTALSHSSKPNTMESITAQQVMDFLTDLQNEGEDLSSITINYRHDEDSDVEVCVKLEEDLFDQETNSRLTSIVFLTK